ncbi:helix-turn-helix domain-containing protein [candidate division WOR-3 bacterium]|nr:helix-turn-helix domain-containing protein [candidate division WOR-3 bacterium]
MEKLLDISQLSEFLSVKQGTIYWWVSIDYIPYYKINRLVRFKKEEIMEWLKKKKHTGRRELIPQINLDS